VSRLSGVPDVDRHRHGAVTRAAGGVVVSEEPQGVLPSRLRHTHRRVVAETGARARCAARARIASTTCARMPPCRLERAAPETA
jgi:hypothetical protein